MYYLRCLLSRGKMNIINEQTYADEGSHVHVLKSA